ncbi:Imm21 family immunity protein [Streptomyces sp. NPDC088736]|uniref:Imm21 family immunity protein n=1 Tax=Streptomyces sp. NPDC088736 TaxID=3365881 RepID=UPI003816CED0
MDSENSWVTSAGGPLILIPESVCYQWAAAPCTYPDNEGDYGRACEVDGYVGLIDVGGAQSLVLGDMPARTTFLPRHNVLVREIAGGEDDAGLSDLVANLIPRVEWETGPTWTVSEPVILFDSLPIHRDRHGGTPAHRPPNGRVRDRGGVHRNLQ